MILSILAAFLIAKLKKYKITPVFKTYELYPLFAVELVYWFFQINSFFGIYDYVKYASIIQKAFLLVMLVPIIKNKIYYPALVGSWFVVFGSVLNEIVKTANGGKMPVYPSLSRLTGYYKNDLLSQGIDDLHIKLTSQTKFNFLADYIDVGWCIMSIGDVFIHSFITIIVYYTIKTLNNKEKSDMVKLGE